MNMNVSNQAYDVFTAPINIINATAKIHNVTVIDVQSTVDGYGLLIVEHAGQRRELKSANKCTESVVLNQVGKVGYVQRHFLDIDEMPVKAYSFHAYIDQSLRRVPELDASQAELDASGPSAEIVGWVCDLRPNGFRAPLGIIPGAGGAFMSDDTVSINLRVPLDFVRECKRYQRTPIEVLRGFVGDIIAAQNYKNYPRADGYQCNGSDECDYAEAWLNRAYGYDVIDLDEIEEKELAEVEENAKREEFASLLYDFEESGGDPDELFKIVKAMIDKQAK